MDEPAAEPSIEPESIVDQARRRLADADPAAVYRSMAGLVRSSHTLLQPISYSASLAFHQPTCVAVEPEPSTAEAIHLYGRAAYPHFDRDLVDTLASPTLDHLMTEVYHLLVAEGRNIALVTNHGQIIDIALESGYQSASRFYAAFKEFCGCSPQEYRQSVDMRDLPLQRKPGVWRVGHN